MESKFKDPVCGMSAQGSKYRSSYKGRDYYFCSPGCKQKFDADPERYVKSGI